MEIWINKSKTVAAILCMLCACAHARWISTDTLKARSPAGLTLLDGARITNKTTTDSLKVTGGLRAKNVSLFDSVGVGHTNEIWYDGQNIDNGTLVINHRGFHGGTTRFRDLVILNGKTVAILTVDGSAPEVTIDGDFNVNGAAYADRIGVAGYTFLGGSEYLKVYTYKAALVAGDLTATYKNVTTDNITLSKVRSLTAILHDISGTDVYATTDAANNMHLDPVMTTTTNCYVDFDNMGGIQAGDTVRVMITVAE